MALWCRDMKTVMVPRAEGPKRVTLVVPYYQNADFLKHQISVWSEYPEELQAHLSVIVVDDGSPEPAVIDGPLPFDLRLFRIETDVRWNWLAARNLGALKADKGWMLLTDMDHVLPAKTLREIIFNAHDPSVVYAFNRREYDGTVLAPHSASFLMHRDMFWTIGGYDEALSGYYGTDGEYRRRLAKHAPIQILRDELERHEYCGDSSTVTYKRKQPEDAAVGRIVSARKPGWSPRTLSFPYHEVPISVGVLCRAR